MADVTLRVRLATEQADRDAARFRDRLTAGLKSANESLERIGKTQAFTGLVLAGELFFKSAELGAKAVKAIASGITDATMAAVDAGKASGAFVRGLEAAEKSARKLVESFGEAVSRSGAVQGGLAAIDEAARSLTEYLAGPDGRGAVDAFFRAFSLGLANTIDAVLGAKKMMRDFLAWAMDAENAPKGSRAAALLGPASQGEQIAKQLADRLRQVGTAAPRVDDGARGLTTKAAKAAAETAADRLRSQHEAERKQLADRDAFFRSGLEREREIAELTERVRQENFDREMENQARREDAWRDVYQSREQGLAASLQSELELWQRRNDTIEAMEGTAAQMASDGIANVIVGMTQAIAAGEGDLGAIAGKLLGGTIVQIGTMLTQLGTAGILAGTLGTLIPALMGITGGPLGVAAGSAALAGGVAMIALGTAMGAAAAPSGGARPSVGSGAGARGPMAGSFASSAPQGYQSTPPRDLAPAVTIVVQGAIVGSAAELGRYVERALAASGRLRVGAT